MTLAELSEVDLAPANDADAIAKLGALGTHALAEGVEDLFFTGI